MTSKAQQVQQENASIMAVLSQHPMGLTRGKIAEALPILLNHKTLQRRLMGLIQTGQITKTGTKKATHYQVQAQRQHLQQPFSQQCREEPETYHSKPASPRTQSQVHPIFTTSSMASLGFLQTPIYARPVVAYNRQLLEQYTPNQTHYLPLNLKQQLFAAGQRIDQALAAGTYAKHICQRLLIDLSYHSSRLEGNTYSQLDTQKLLEEGIAAKGKMHEETVMIMNHKEAILFLVDNAQTLKINPFTICNVHHLLAQDLLPNPHSCGSIRSSEVHIGQSTYKPLNNAHQLHELFEWLLLKAQHITDPFEQSFFLLVHLSYLQAFEDVNKRTARLACNIPFIQHNLCPLSFTDVPRDDYTAALLAIYEHNQLQPMAELFAWAYLRACQQYRVVKQSLGQIDAYRIQYRQQRKAIMGQIVKHNLHGPAAQQHIERYCQQQGISNPSKFVAMTLADLNTLHVGALAGLGVAEAELEVWLKDAMGQRKG